LARSPNRWAVVVVEPHLDGNARGNPPLKELLDGRRADRLGHPLGIRTVDASGGQAEADVCRTACPRRPFDRVGGMECRVLNLDSLIAATKY
jgi:hypothetical protein